jgi:hypothetical protein
MVDMLYTFPTPWAFNLGYKSAVSFVYIACPVALVTDLAGQDTVRTLDAVKIIVAASAVRMMFHSEPLISESSFFRSSRNGHP